jgi:hypothetical protein
MSRKYKRKKKAMYLFAIRAFGKNEEVSSQRRRVAARLGRGQEDIVLGTPEGEDDVG